MYEPARVTKGSTHQWRRSLPNFLPAAGWTLTYGFSNGTEQVSITATNFGDGTHLATIAIATFAEKTPGEWEWRAYVTKASQRFDAGRGSFLLEADIASAAHDVRSIAKKTLDALNAMIAGKASVDQAAMSIGDRSLSRMQPEELLKWRRTYATFVRQEDAAAARAQGRPGGSKIRFRFPGK